MRRVFFAVCVAVVACGGLVDAPETPEPRPVGTALADPRMPPKRVSSSTPESAGAAGAESP